MASVGDYAIVLTAGAREAIREMCDEEKQQVAAALRVEVLDRHGIQNPYIEISAGPAQNYPARLLSSGHIAVFRLMTAAELRALARQRDRPVARRGVVVHDILSGDDKPRSRGDLLGAFGSLV